MLSKPGPSQPEDEITRKLREAARRKRPWSWRSLGLVLAVFVGVPAVVVWWTWPRPDPPPLEIVAQDRLANPGTEVSLTAVLIPLNEEDRDADLEGYEIIFEEPSLQGVAASKQEQTKSNGEGRASVSWKFPEGRDTVDFVVRHFGPKHHTFDRARVYFWPADTPLLLVDTPSSLTTAAADAWDKSNFWDIAPVPEAIRALREVEKEKYQVIYLAHGLQNPLAYRKIRGWLQNRAAGKDKFPPGPVLGRSTFLEEEGKARYDLLKELKGRFSGPMAAVTGRADFAAQCRALEIRTFILGNEKTPPEIIRLASWEKLADALEKGK